MSETTSNEINQVLDDARHVIEVTPEESDEARRRRLLLAEAVEAAFPGSRHFFSGSVAHRDALTPLNDVDLGVAIGTAGVGSDDLGPDANGPPDRWRPHATPSGRR